MPDPDAPKVIYDPVTRTYHLETDLPAAARAEAARKREIEALAPAATVAAEADSRVVNNTMRHAYRVLSDQEKDDMVALKDQGLAFIELCDRIGSSRELSLAKTKMEEAVMWAVKSLTR